MTAPQNPGAAGNPRILPDPQLFFLGCGTSRAVPADNSADGAARDFSFITDPPALRRARLEAAKARLAWYNARNSKIASERLHRAYVVATAAVIAAEVRDV